MSAQMLQVTVTAQQPLALGIDSEVSFYTGSHRFVPGSVLRGALAAAWIAESGPPTVSPAAEARFRALFDADIRFGPLLPAGGQRAPLSVARCKYPRDNTCRQVAVDYAFQDTAGCPGCGQRLEPSRGELELPEDAGPVRITRTSIDPTTMRAKEGELYAHGALPAATVLTGHLFGDDPWLHTARTIRLGGRRTVGGTATYRTTAVPLPQPPATGPTLVIRLIGPAVLVDAAGRPRLDPDPDLDLPEGVRVERRWVRPMTWSGWHAASRLPKPDEICPAPGSTYRLTGDPQALTKLARRLLRDGIGLRRAEGFGVVEIADRPWRPAAAPDPGRRGRPPLTEAARRLGILREITLDAGQRKWLADALRTLQVEHRRSGIVDKALDELLTQPVAAGLAGAQRDRIRGALAGVTAVDLRDLTTLYTDVTRPQDRSGQEVPR